MPRETTRATIPISESSTLYWQCLRPTGKASGREKMAEGSLLPSRIRRCSQVPACQLISSKPLCINFRAGSATKSSFLPVLDKYKSPERLNFVDDARMVNVAVSRAKSRFTLVTGDNVFKTSNGHIAALIRYMEYYADDGQVHRAPVISAFDLLYKEYDRSLERLNKRLNPNDSLFKSEQIVAQILREALAQEPRRGIMFHREIRLMQLAAVARASFTERELEFMRNAARCDFVLYFKVGKTPLGVIEVDGGYHDDPLQIERDAVKNSILNKCGIPLLRLRTIESRIEEKVAAFLDQWTPPARDESRRVSPG
ncbi:ATP-binding protein [Pseudomonas savastanoi pv. glycinea]|nr:ATP-binding protein [Pseudomonas savastanoi pv. glycinea]